MEKDNKSTVIVTGGQCKITNQLKSYANSSYVIAADSGYDTCKALEIVPNLLVGDMDSVSAVPTDVELYRVKSEKDFTDTMLAVGIALERGTESITVIGGGGGRADHWLSNVFLLESLCDKGVRGKLCDGENEIFILKDSEDKIPKGVRYFGLLALEDSTVTVTGCKYPLFEHKLTRSLPYAVSNEVTDEFATVQVKGKIIVSITL